jgi:hypothetical protein
MLNSSIRKPALLLLLHKGTILRAMHLVNGLELSQLHLCSRGRVHICLPFPSKILKPRFTSYLTHQLLVRRPVWIRLFSHSESAGSLTNKVVNRCSPLSPCKVVAGRTYGTHFWDLGYEPINQQLEIERVFVPFTGHKKCFRGEHRTEVDTHLRRYSY